MVGLTIRFFVRFWLAGLAVSVLVFAAPIPTGAFNMGYHYDLIREAARRLGLNKDAYSVMLAGNSYVDIFQVSETEYVIDDDFCEVSKTLVECLHFDQVYDSEAANRYWRQLIQNTYDAVVYAIRRNDPCGLLLAVGASLHIVQDFYAHSNWVELDISRYTQKKDTTYFEVIANPASALVVLGGSTEIDSRLPFRRYDHDVGLFTHGSRPTMVCQPTGRVFTKETEYSVPRPVHSALHKDHNGRSYFPWAYRCAYKASLQWLMLVEKWVKQDLNRPDFWERVKNYSFPGNKNHLYRLTDFDEGTIRWLCTYGGGWKCPRKWSTGDTLMDDMPNVPGIGVTAQNYPDYPFLGIEWFENCFNVAKNLFESKRVDPGGTHIVERLSPNILNLPQAVRDKNDFGEIVKISLEEVNFSQISKVDTPVVRSAISYLATCLGDSYEQVRWLRIGLPKVEDMDPGSGLFNVNNEEVGGTSDYWPMFIINDWPYTEAEYVDQSAPYTMWGVLKPLWNVDTVRIHLKLYESDPWNHKAIKMRISPQGDLQFTFDPVGGGTLLDLPTSCEWYSTPTGFFIKSQGSDSDWGARVFLKIGLMSDRMIEFIVQTHNDEGAATGDGVQANVGSYVWELDHPDYDDFKPQRLRYGLQQIDMWCKELFTWQKKTDIYVFDPGLSWTRDKFYRLLLHKDRGRNDAWHVTRFYGRTADVTKGSDKSPGGVWLNSGNPTWAAEVGTLPRLAFVPEAVPYSDAVKLTGGVPGGGESVSINTDAVDVYTPQEYEPDDPPAQGAGLQTARLKVVEMQTGPQLQPREMTIPKDRVVQVGTEKPAFSLADQLRKMTWYISVITKTADVNDAQTNNPVYISFLDSNKNVLARYLLDNFIRKDFDRGNTDFFWLEMQYNRLGVSFVRPQFEYSRIKHIRLEKPGDDDWYIEELEVWVNDLLLYQGRPSFWLNRANQQRDIPL